MLLIELTGDAPDIAVEEVRALAIAYGQCFSVIESDGRVLVTETNVPIGKLQERLALSWSIGKHHSSCEYHEIVNSTSDLSLPGRTFRVSVKRLDGTASPEEAVRITRELGAALSINHEVNLDNPDVEVLVLLGERAHIGIIRANIDRTLLEARKSENRPFSQPISLHPKFIRAMVNLTGIREGQFLLDPFCGTGGILLEAGLMEIRTYGSDIDERMIDGTRQNLEHFGVQDFQLNKCDVSETPSIFPQVDAIATDPPYGRSSSTAKENVDELYERAFKAFHKTLKPGGKLAIVLPSEEHLKHGEIDFTLLGEYPVRVHRSLTRRFCLYQR